MSPHSRLETPFDGNYHIRSFDRTFDAMFFADIRHGGRLFAFDDRPKSSVMKNIPMVGHVALDAFLFDFSKDMIEQLGNPCIVESLFGTEFFKDFGHHARFDIFESAKLLVRYSFLSGLLSKLAGKIAVKGSQQQCPEAPLGLIGALYQPSAEYNFLKKTLGKVLGSVVVVTFLSEVAVNRFPV